MPRKPDRKKSPRTSVALASKVGDMVCGVLHTVYVEKSEAFRKESLKDGVPVESLAAAAITQLMADMGAFGGIPEPGPAPAGSSNAHHDFPPLPEIPANLVDPVRCLARVAAFFHRSTIDAYAGEMDGLTDEGRQMLAVSESILQQWLDHSGVTQEGLLGNDVG